MTKINKLGKSTFVIAILSFLLVAVLAFGGTYAYFFDKSATATGSFTTGTLQINDTNFTSAAVFEASGTIAPGAPLTKGAMAVDIDTDIKTAVLAVMEVVVTGTGSDISINDIVLENGDAFAVTGWDVAKTSTDGTKKAYVYNKDSKMYVEADATATLISEKLYLSNQVTNGASDSTTTFENQGVSITINVTFYAIQYDYLAKNGQAGAYDDAEALYAVAAPILGITIS